MTYLDFLALSLDVLLFYRNDNVGPDRLVPCWCFSEWLEFQISTTPLTKFFYLGIDQIKDHFPRALRALIYNSTCALLASVVPHGVLHLYDETVAYRCDRTRIGPVAFA